MPSARHDPATTGSVADTIRRFGGVASWAELTAEHADAALRRSVRAGEIVRAGRGRYVLAEVEGWRRFAHGHSATLAGPAAANWHGWPLVHEPTMPWLTVPRHRKPGGIPSQRARVSYADLRPEEQTLGVTNHLRTVVDCARWLPWPEALAVADSALRSGTVHARDLARTAATARGDGAGQVRRVAASASAKAANPLESAARALALDATEVPFRPQVLAWDSGLFATVDVGDEALRIAIEVEGPPRPARE